jgi:hypothetical protein
LFVLGHSVVGTRMVRLVRKKLRLGWLVFGALLPDLIDKPLYYGLVFATGRRAADLGLISGTRTVGHTAIFLFLFIGLAWLFRRRPAGAVLTAIAWGVASHVLLDNLGDLPGVMAGTHGDGPSTLDGFIYPLHGARFPFSPFHGIAEHLMSATRLYVLAGEFLGLALLADAWRQRRAARAVK